MFMKLLLTALVIAAAILTLRMRRQPPRVVRVASQAHSSGGPGRSLPKIAAYGVLITMLAGSGYFVYRQWQDEWQVVAVHIVNSDSGKESTYQAYRGDIDERSFRTTDGRVVNLAAVERMEVKGTSR